VRVSEVLRGSRVNTVLIELDVRGSRLTGCTKCGMETEHATLEAGLIMCSLCRRLRLSVR